ncbi:MAG: PadR family transcriptional regulator [Nocardiopsaceae bacterium]|nr:PadR family transcriptional regulator [Nocardiopsaceae bacterium]
MMAATCGTKDFGDIQGLRDLKAALQEFFGSAGGVFGPSKHRVFAQAAGRRHSAPWEKMHGGRKGPGPWGGGPWGGGGPFGAWWAGPPGPPGPHRGRKAGRGDVRAAILALLREGPLNGYQIMSEIEERSNGAWRPSPGAVYPALSQLADEGLIEGAESAGRRTFSLTDAGREYVEQNPDMARGAWESETQQEAWEVPGLFAEAARLGGGIVQIAHNGSPDQVRAAERLLQRARRDLYRILAEDEDDQDVDDEDVTGQDAGEQEA